MVEQRGPHARTTKLGNLDDVIAVTDIEMEPEDLDSQGETYRPRPVLGAGGRSSVEATMTASVRSFGERR